LSRRDNQTILDEIALALSFAPRQSSLRRDRQNGHPDCRCLPIQIVALQAAPSVHRNRDPGRRELAGESLGGESGALDALLFVKRRFVWR
jgi:hypothetical protein